jgi:hypothetical protein
MSSKCMRSILSLMGCLLGLGLCGAAPAAAECPNEALRYGYGAYLPDCRAYEQASPVDKGGSDVIGGRNLVQAAPDGGAVTFFDPLGLPGIAGSTAEFPIYIASRGSSGWSTVNLLPPASASWGGTFPAGVSHIGWSPDLTTALAFGNSVPPSGQPAVVLSDTQSGAYEVIGTGEGEPYLDGFSADDSRVVFEDKAQLLPGATAGEDNVYEWDRTSGQLYLVDVLPDGSVPASGAFAASYDIDGANTSVGGAKDGQVNTPSAISSEGSEVYFTAQADSGRDAGVDQVFVRESLTSPAAMTVMVSASQRTNATGEPEPDPNGPQPAAFWTASSDGSRVFFTSPEELTNYATTGSADQGNDLYEYDLDTGVLTDLTPDASDLDGAEVQGVVGASSDGSYVYFVANGVLAPEATAGTCKGEPRQIAKEGACNLYVWHEGVTTFIAQLNAAPSPKVSADWQDWNPGENLSNPEFREHTARVTPDGRTLLFKSAQRLTAYDNEGYDELYRYSAPTASAPTGQLLCVSCDPSGTAPAGSAALEQGIFGDLSSGAAPLLTRNLSADGGRVFFQSPDQLTAISTGGVENVYEWEADHEGSCTGEAEDGGCLYLISTGRSPDDSYFAEASENGDDVFFFTDQPLVGQDKDELMDIYDARVDGGLASQNPAVESPCVGEVCHGEPPPATSLATPTSAAFSGAGNLTPSPVPVAAKGATKPLTRAQKLAQVLAACRSKPKRRIAGCERQARKRYRASRSRTFKKGAHR